MKKFVDAYARWPRNLRGSMWMLASALTFTLMTTLIKYLGEDYPAALQTFYRQLAGVLVLVPVILKGRSAVFATTRPGILIFRSTAGVVANILAFYAYQKMPLAEANALSFSRALWLVPLAVFALEEKVGPRRIIATIVGFLGVLLMLQPSAHTHFGWPAVAALSSSFLFALTITGMKFMTRDHSTTTLMVWAATLGLVLAFPPALFVWRWPTLIDLSLLALMGVLGTVTQICYINGMQEGDAAVMAPIDYTRLIFAVLLGYVLFSDVPNSTTMMGAAVVIASTLYITFRELKLGVAKVKTTD